MPHEPVVTTHREPFFHPNVTPEEQHQTTSEYKRHIAAAASEAARREMGLLRSLNPPRVPQVEPPSLRQPVLPEGFDAAGSDEAIYQRGVAVSDHKLLTLGCERFQELLARDHDVRSYQRVLFGDLSTWPSVAHSFATVNALRANVPPRKTKEQLSGQGEDRELAGQIDSWRDLWKVSQEPESVRRVYDFHDAFARLIFGQSLLERLGNNGRVRSRMFCGGEIKRGAYFADWLSTLEGYHFKVTLAQPLFSVVAWICQERTPPPQDLTLDWLGKHAPTQAEIQRCQAVVEGFLLGLESWALWDYVGQRTRRAVDHGVLETWRKSLVERYPAIARFHQYLRDFFWKPAGADGYRRFDVTAYHAYLKRELDKLLQVVSLLTAAAIEEIFNGALVARFSDWFLCQGIKPKALPASEKIEHKLSVAFPGSRFDVNVEPL
jgi:hypothetical protein